MTKNTEISESTKEKAKELADIYASRVRKYEPILNYFEEALLENSDTEFNDEQVEAIKAALAHALLPDLEEKSSTKLSEDFSEFY